MYEFCEAYYGTGYQNIIDFINGIDENPDFYSVPAEWVEIK